MRCHCSGAARISSSKRYASSWVTRATSSRSRPSARPARAAARRRGARPGRPEVHRGRAAAARRCAAPAWPAPPAAWCCSPKNSTSMPSPARSRSRQQAHDPVVAQRAAAPRRRPPGPSGTTSMPRRAPGVGEPLEQLGRLDRLDHDRGRVALHRQPRAGVVPRRRRGAGRGSRPCRPRPRPRSGRSRRPCSGRRAARRGRGRRGAGTARTSSGRRSRRSRRPPAAGPRPASAPPVARRRLRSTWRRFAGATIAPTAGRRARAGRAHRPTRGRRGRPRRRRGTRVRRAGAERRRHGAVRAGCGAADAIAGPRLARRPPLGEAPGGARAAELEPSSRLADRCDGG